MLINHKISMDLMEKKTPARIEVKQGDTLSRSLQITLFSGGEVWPIPAGVTPLIRWAATDPDTGETASGIYDTLSNGINAITYAQNQMDLILVPQMFALAGLVQCDLEMIQGNRTLATFNFEFYVNRSPVEGVEAKAQDWYKLASLEQINTAISDIQEWQSAAENTLTELDQKIIALQEWQATTDRLLADLEHEIFSLKRVVEQM